MAQSKRILFVAGDVAPFTEVSSIADLVRTLPEQLQDAGDYEARIMMPCYGTISERKHNLHEVIRLSGTDVPMGDDTETLTVKVASIPDVRLQVYFMDHEDYFGRDGTGSGVDGDGSTFDDNARRALFFSRAVLETLCKLRWGPDVIHAFGWIGGLTPLLLGTEYEGDETLGNTASVYTPDPLELNTSLPADFADTLGVIMNDADADTLTELGIQKADATIYPSDAADGHEPRFADDPDARIEQLVDLYEQMLREVPA